MSKIQRIDEAEAKELDDALLDLINKGLVKVVVIPGKGKGFQVAEGVYIGYAETC